MTRFYLALIAVALLPACSLLPSVDPQIKTQLWVQHQVAIGAIQSWKIKGRVAVKSIQNSGTVSLLWQQNRRDYQIRLIAPLGQGSYILTGSPSGVVMQTAEGNITRASNAEQLLYEKLGWRVPFHELEYWLKGLPLPSVKPVNLLLDERGRLKKLEQSGFQINIDTYGQQGDVSLPSQIKIKNDIIELKIAIQDWHF